MENNKERSEEQLFINLQHYIDISNRGLLWKANHVAKIRSDNCPILYQYGGNALLESGETLEKLVYSGFITGSRGYSGLYECVKYITGENHWEGKGKVLAHKILDFLNKANDDLNEKTGLSIGLYGVPQEVLTDKFARACIRDFGEVGDGSKRHYLVNSYHIPPAYKINAFDKLSIEEQFSDKTLGGKLN